jgi:hypothetical protein
MKNLPHVDLRASSTPCSPNSSFFPSFDVVALLPVDECLAESNPILLSIGGGVVDDDGVKDDSVRLRYHDADDDTTRWTASQEAIEDDEAVSKGPCPCSFDGSRYASSVAHTSGTVDCPMAARGIVSPNRPAASTTLGQPGRRGRRVAAMELGLGSGRGGVKGLQR